MEIQQDDTDEDLQYSEFIAWKEHPVTQKVQKYLREMRSFYINRLLVCELTELGSVGKCVGSINVIDDLLNLEFKPLTTSERED